MRKVKSPLLRCLQRAMNQDKHQALEAKKAEAISSSRRKFLGDATVLAGAFGLSFALPSSLYGNLAQGRMVAGRYGKEASVAIVGAGIAGLNAAYLLQKAGVRAQVFEADTRVGGRIYTKDNLFGPDLVTELGGEFIDTDHQDMIALAQEFNLELMDMPADALNSGLIKETYFFAGRHYSEEEVVRAFKKAAKRIRKDRKKCGEDYDRPKVAELDQISLEEYVRSLPCETWMQDLLIAAYVAEFGLEAGEQSCLNLIDLIGTETKDGFKVFGDSDERYKVKGGNQRIVDALKQSLDGQIQTGHRLVAVKSDGAKVVLSFDGAPDFTADFAVLTLPFTVLRQIDLKLEGMTEAKRACIQELGYGQNSKLILGFNERVWRQEAPHYAGYLFHPDIHNGWDSTQMQGGNAGRGSYTVYLGANAALRASEASAQAGLKNALPESFVRAYLDKVDAVFSGARAQFNELHYAALWPSNPFAGGSYSAYRVGQWSSISGEEGTTVGNVLFAGEHCSSDFQGYMNGGAESGRRAAEELLAILS